MLEVLSDFQITIPELGTIKALHRPYVIITSNQTRELHDALKQRCLYHWIDYPSLEKELRIVFAKVPLVEKKLAEQVCIVPSRLHLYIFVGSSSYSSTSIPRRRLDLLLNATWYYNLKGGGHNNSSLRICRLEADLDGDIRVELAPNFRTVRPGGYSFQKRLLLLLKYR